MHEALRSSIRAMSCLSLALGWAGVRFQLFFVCEEGLLASMGATLFFVTCASLAQAFLAAAFPIKEAIAFKLGLHLQLFCVTNKNTMSKFIHRAVRKVPLQQLVRLQQKNIFFCSPMPLANNGHIPLCHPGSVVQLQESPPRPIKPYALGL